MALLHVGTNLPRVELKIWPRGVRFLTNLLLMTLKDSLMKSPLTDKMFGLSLQKVQEEVSKAPQSVSVDVRLNDGKRTIVSSSSGYQPTPTFSAKKRKVVRRKQYANFF
jgi:hypothetical protein